MRLETLLPLTLELHHSAGLPLLPLLATLTCQPADLLGLPLGRLRKGGPADLVLFDLNAPWRIEVDRFRSKSKNSPFDERPVQGRVSRTVVDGRTVPVQHIAPAPRPGQVGGSSYRVGERVFHQKFGYGEVVAADENRLEIEFEKAGRKKVVASFVERAPKT